MVWEQKIGVRIVCEQRYETNILWLFTKRRTKINTSQVLLLGRGVVDSVKEIKKNLFKKNQGLQEV